MGPKVKIGKICRCNWYTKSLSLIDFGISVDIIILVIYFWLRANFKLASTEKDGFNNRQVM